MPASMYASMEPRSSRLLSGRRVPNRHSARFISRSALAIAIDALPPFSRFPRGAGSVTVDRTAPALKGKSEGPRLTAGAPAVLPVTGQTPIRSQTKISVSPGLMAGVGLWSP
ncbi:hypothetical protein GCM10010286_59850 [Streptomyces toxytricini]|nr:hypothetical protein GCM10010286_59850 [Streptomyces toxytricini]